MTRGAPRATAAPAPESSPPHPWLRRLVGLALEHRRLSVVVVALSLIAVVFHAAVPAILGRTIDAMVAASSGGVVATLVRWLGLFAGVAVGRAIFSHLARVSLYRLSYLVEADLRSSIFEHLTGLPMSFHDRANTGQLVSRANSEARAVQRFVVYAPYLLMMSGTFVLALGYMLSIDVVLTLVAIAFLPPIFLLGVRLRRLMYPWSWLIQSRLADVATIVDENVNGQRLVKLFAQEERQIGLLRTAAARVRWAVIEMIEARVRYTPWIEKLPLFAQAFVLLYGGRLVLDGAIAVGDVVAVSVYLGMMQMPFRWLGQVIVLGQKASASIQRIDEILDLELEPADPPDARSLEPTGGSLELDEVVFAYDPEGDGERRRILDGLTFAMEAGETVAIVGRMGCGKSTLGRLLVRFYEPEDGRMRIDDQDLGLSVRSSVRRHVVVAPNEPFLFSASVRDNIAYGRPGAGDQEVRAAARAARADGFIADLPKGYDTVLGERGYDLSGGQRQRIGLARALLLDPAVLVLDDATSAVDVVTEEAIYRQLAEIRRSKTTILIGHRLSTVINADRVMVLEDGAVVASGTHQELLATLPDYVRLVLRETPDEAVDEPPDEESDEEFAARIRSKISLPDFEKLNV